MTNIRDYEEKIFEKYMTDNIVKDGIIDPSKYNKILFILKEVNSEDSDWSLVDFVSKGARAPTWNNITRWTKGILNLSNEFDWSTLIDISENDRSEILKNIAVINLKKTPGGSSSDMSKIDEYAYKHRDLIIEQIKLYAPEYIICCGTGNSLNYDELLETIWQTTSRGIKYLDNGTTILIQYLHPQARIKNNFLYYQLIDAIREIENKR